MVDIILLISGNSKRMGQEKALLSFSDRINFVYHLIEVYLGLPNTSIFVIVNENNYEKVKKACDEFKQRVVFVVNTHPEKGRLFSILKGINKVENGRGVFIQNIDNPFTSVKLLEKMLKIYQLNTFVVPQFHGKNGHPLLLGANLVQEIKNKADSLIDFKSFLNRQEKHILITHEETIVANINSPEEYREWFPDIKLNIKV